MINRIGNTYLYRENKTLNIKLKTDNSIIVQADLSIYIYSFESAVGFELLISLLFNSSMKYLDTHHLDPSHMLLIFSLMAISFPNLCTTSSVMHMLNSTLNTLNLFL